MDEECYESAVDKLADDDDEQLFVAFPRSEDKYKKMHRARCMYKFALDHIPKGQAEVCTESLLHLKSCMKGLWML